MTLVFNTKETKDIRRKLRSQPISAERKMWYKLRKRQLGFRFNRQYGIGKYVVDFYCAEKKLVIEIDGVTHATDEEIACDKERTTYLLELGLKIKRYKNSDVYNNMDLVIDDVVKFLNRC